MTLSGRGNGQSEAVQLSGNYAIAWQITSPPESLCVVNGYLKSSMIPNFSESLMTMLQVPAGKSMPGESHTYGRAPGRYYVQMVTTSCIWSVTLTPSA